jgi:hypothetical protein
MLLPEKIILPRKLRILTSSRSSSVLPIDATSLQVIIFKIRMVIYWQIGLVSSYTPIKTTWVSFCFPFNISCGRCTRESLENNTILSPFIFKSTF